MGAESVSKLKAWNNSVFCLTNQLHKILRLRQILDNAFFMLIVQEVLQIFFVFELKVF